MSNWSADPLLRKKSPHEIPASLMIPGRKERVTTKQLQWALLNWAFPMFYNGMSYDLKHKRIGPGVYEVWMERQP